MFYLPGMGSTTRFVTYIMQRMLGPKDMEQLPIYGSVALDDEEIKRRKETLKNAPPKPPDGKHHYYYWNGHGWIAHHK